MTEVHPQVLLQAVNLSVSRGELTLFKERSFTVEAGTLLQLQGDNGSGKTTLLRALCTLIPLDEGELRWRGELLPGAREAYFSEMVFAGHADGLKAGLTPLENLLCNLSDKQVSVDECVAVLERTGLAGKEQLPCRVLSAGQRRRVALSRLLLSDTALWILDEPLTALDASGRDLVASLIDEQVQRGGSVIYSTHQPLPGSSTADTQTLVLSN